MGRPLRTHWDLLKPDIGQKVRSKQADQVAHHDHYSKYRSFQTGEMVLAKNFRPGAPWVKGKIIQQLAPLTFLVEVEQGLHWRRHIDHLKPLPSAPDIQQDPDENPNGETEAPAEAPQATTESTTDNEPNTTSSVDDTTNTTPTPATPGPPERRYPTRNWRPN